jgi:hypothetical protein
MIQTGETFTLTATPANIGMPAYELSFDDGGTDQPTPVVRLTYSGDLALLEGSSEVLELVSAEASSELAEFELAARRAGRIVLHVSVTGEIHPDNSGPTIWGGSTASIEIEVR